MKVRRLISLIMAIMVLTTLCMPMSHATEPEYLEYTITFDNVSIMPLSEPFENNVQAAKDYVQSLSLDEYGFGYIEDAC